MNTETILKAFLVKQSKALELTEDKIREELSSEFGEFSVREISKYTVYLQNFKIIIEREAEQAKLEEERMRKALQRRVEPFFCPYHEGIRVVGIYWARDSWRCGIGGLSCYLRWKAEKIVGHSLEEAYRKWEESHETKKTTAVIAST